AEDGIRDLIVTGVQTCALPICWAAFWPASGEEPLAFVQPVTFSVATSDAAQLKYLDGGGDGCTWPTEKPSFARRHAHHLAFYGRSEERRVGKECRWRWAWES